MAFYPNYIYSIIAFIGFVLALIPLPWHINAWNAGTCLYMIWTALGCFNLFINSIVWNGNMGDHAPVWCDISIRIIIGVSTAIPAASLCINRRLYHISCLQTIKVTDAEKRRELIVDFAIALGLPILFIILSYIPQGHRYDIYEDIGCMPVSYLTPIFILFVMAPPVAIGCVTAVYSILSIRAFVIRRKKLRELFADSTSMNTNRYLRLMCLAGIEVLLTVPIGSYLIRLGIDSYGVQPWISWEDTHSGFSRHNKFPTIFWQNLPSPLGPGAVIELNRYPVIVCSFIFFAFFGFAEEARHNYRTTFWSIARRIGYAPIEYSPSASPQVKRSEMTLVGGGITSLTITETSAMKETPARKPASRISAFVAKTLRLTPKPPLLPLTFAPNPRSPTSSHSSFHGDLPTPSNDATDSRDPVKLESSNL